MNPANKTVGARIAMLIASIVLSACSPVHAAPVQAVHFAGIVYLGDYEDLDDNFPQTLRLNRDGLLDQALRGALEQASPKWFSIDFGLANLSQGESTVIAVAVEREARSHEQHTLNGVPTQKYIADLAFQILVLDFGSMTLRAAYPLSYAINDARTDDQAPMDQDGWLALFRSLYLGTPEQPGALQDLARRTIGLNPSEAPRLRFAVRSVETTDAVRAQLPGHQSGKQFENYVGQAFSGELARVADVQVIPYSKDYAIGNQMAARFADGAVYNFKLPVADYLFDLTLQKLIRKPPSEHYSVYGSIIRMQMREEYANTLYIDDLFRFGVSKFNGDLVDEWSGYEDAVQSLLSGLVEQLRAPRKSWMREHARNGGKTYRQFDEKAELFR